MRAIDRFNRFNQKLHNGQDVLKNHFLNQYPIHLTDNTDDYSILSKYADEHDFVWIVDRSIQVYRSFPWWFKPVEQDAVHQFPFVFKASKRLKCLNKVKLVPTKIKADKKITHNHVCGDYDVYFGKDKFDIFFVGNTEIETWNQLKSRFPDAQAVASIEEAQLLSTTDMLWYVPDDVSVSEFFKFSYVPDDWSQIYAHVFGNGSKEVRDGIVLFPKNYQLTEKENKHRYYANKKELSIIASRPIPYDQFVLKTYNDYLNALAQSKTEMFWFVPNDVELVDTFDFDLYFSHQNQYDRNINHVFLNNSMYDGVVLFSKNCVITEKEFDHRFYTNRKEWNVVASHPKTYNRFAINNYDEYLDALKNSKTDMFWNVPSDVEIDKNFNFDLFFIINKEYYNRKTNHVFLNDKYQDGVVLFSKNSPVTKKELENRFYTNKKEWDTVASNPIAYDKFTIDTYDDYIQAQKNSKTDMFWMIPPEVVVNNEFKFDLYFSHHNQYDRTVCHMFMNENTYDGISLISKKLNISEREINMRFFANKKQYKTVASNPKPYDIVFISKDEEHADKNYYDLIKKFPRAKRVHGVTGIHQAHIEAAKLCSTEMFWVVDADAKIDTNFNFDYYVPQYDPNGKKTVHVWRAKNPVNDLVYGYGAVKLLPTDMVLNMDITKPDMTTSISPYFKSVDVVSNVTLFNTDPFSTWRSAFRECVKLSSRIIDRQKDDETHRRLHTWCNIGINQPFGAYAIAGAKAGALYGARHRENVELLKNINNYDWLAEQFNQSTHSTI